MSTHVGDVCLPASVGVCEVVLRDGIQGWPDFIQTDDKITLLDAIDAAGFSEVDVTSFVPSAQFSDASAVLAAVPDRLTTRVLTPNLRGVQRVIAAHREVRTIDFCGIPFSASEPHNVANLRRTHAEHRDQLRPMIAALHDAGVRPLVAIATAYGCPIAGPIESDQVFEIFEWLYGEGVRRVMFGDTKGMADPVRTVELFSSARQAWPEAELVAHFHDNRGVGVANSLAAVAAGADAVDSSLGGLGGEPSDVDQGYVGESGNVATEDLAAVLERAGVATGLTLHKVLDAGAVLEQIVGRSLHSRVQRAGLVRDQSREASV